MTIASMALLALVTLGFDMPVHGGQQGNWLAWQGCWREVSEDADGPILCVLPGAGTSEARMTTVAGGVPGPTTLLRADGVSRPVDEGGCTGTQTAQWSRDGRRVFVRTDMNCEGMRRVSTGILAMIAENEWVEVHAATLGEQHATRTMRYRAVAAAEVPAEIRAELPPGRDLVREAARLHASAPLQIEDVIEASAVVAPPVLQGVLAARGHGFSMNARTLVQLEQAGVARDVIDVVVALSYPRHLAVRGPSPDHGVVPARLNRDLREVECWDPEYGMVRYGYDCDRIRPGYRYGRYGYRYGFGYSPWGYDPYGWNYNTPIVIVVRPDGDGPARQAAQLVKGSGYTRGSGGSDSPAQPRRSSGSGANSTMTSGGSSGSSGTSSGTTGSASSGSSSGASSSSGSGSDTGRTAVPRNGGGGGQ